MKLPPAVSKIFRPIVRSIAGRLTIWYAVSSLLLLFSALVIAYWALETRLRVENQERLETEARLVGALLMDALPAAEAVKKIREEASSPAGAEVFVRVLFADGSVMAESPGMKDELPEKQFPQRQRPTVVTGATGRHYWAITKRFEGQGFTQPHVVQAASWADNAERVILPFRWRMWIGLVVAFVFCGAAGYRIAKSGIAPLRGLLEASQKVQSSTLDMRIDTAPLPTELVGLGKTINQMLDRLQDAFERVSSFSDDIAHELGTPLGIIRGQMEVALASMRTPGEYRETLESSLEEIVSLSGLVQRLLLLARIDNQKAAPNLECRDIGAELALIRDFYEPLAGAGGVSLQVVSAGAAVMGPIDRILFQCAIGNLLTNSIRYTPSGGKVVLEVSQGQGQFLVTVSDTGAGIPAERLSQVFDRFHRGEPARETAGNHVGLGLAIVKSVVELHRGQISMDSRIGEGTRTTIHMPAP